MKKNNLIDKDKSQIEIFSQLPLGKYFLELIHFILKGHSFTLIKEDNSSFVSTSISHLKKSDNIKDVKEFSFLKNYLNDGEDTLYLNKTLCISFWNCLTTILNFNDGYNDPPKNNYAFSYNDKLFEEVYNKGTKGHKIIEGINTNFFNQYPYMEQSIYQRQVIMYFINGLINVIALLDNVYSRNMNIRTDYENELKKKISELENQDKTPLQKKRKDKSILQSKNKLIPFVKDCIKKGYSIEDVALELKIKKRTLQQQLHNYNTTFKEIRASLVQNKSAK